MFRGEPLSLYTLLFGLFSFNLILLVGMHITGIIYLAINLATQIHYLLVFFGWIGGLMLGAQLQFFKAFTGHRKYNPQILRYMYHISFIIGIFLILLGTHLRNNIIFIAGLISILITTVIHQYWLMKLSGRKAFKFPLDYFMVSHLFLITSISALIIQQIYVPNFPFINKTAFTHVLAIGWVSLSLQGALIRILPMFLNKSIDFKSRNQLPLHFKSAAFSSIAFSLTFVFRFPTIVHITFSTIWVLVWLWTFQILIRSIISNKRSLNNFFTAWFVLPGLLMLVIGSILGIFLPFTQSSSFTTLRRFHIHYTLLFGLSMIMLGVLHRVTSFQINTILYTGEKDKRNHLNTLLRGKSMKIIAWWILVSMLVYSYGIFINNFTIWGIGGGLIFTGIIGYDYIIISNFILYLKEKSKAIPFHLKPSEYENNEDI